MPFGKSYTETMQDIHGQVYELWKLLDDIDSLDDVCKSNDECFRNETRRLQQKRWQVVEEAAVADLYEEFGGAHNGPPSDSIVAKVAAKYQKKKEVPKADGKGTTTVYEYSERQIANRNRDKAERVEGLRSQIGDLRKQYRKDLKAGMPS